MPQALKSIIPRPPAILARFGRKETFLWLQENPTQRFLEFVNPAAGFLGIGFADVKTIPF